MIAKLEFDCSVPEEAEKMKRMFLADDLCSVIHNLQKYLWDKSKFTEKFKSAESELKHVGLELYELMEEKGISLDDIYS